MHDGMPYAYGRIQGQRQGHEPIQGSRIENLQSREVDRQSPTGLIFLYYVLCLGSGLVVSRPGLLLFIIYYVIVHEVQIRNVGTCVGTRG